MTNDLRALLPRTAGVFFGRFAHATEIQTSAIPLILEGRDVLLTAPTAAGKTEAYAAPILERLLGSRRGSLHALVLSPTRALVNDLERRLAERFEALGVSYGRLTGEHKERPGGRLPEVVLTTPESLDSMLARNREALRTVRAVVLDEVHVLDGTSRGDQTRILLNRLERAAELRPQRLAASATVSNAEGLAARYLRAAALVRTGASRPIRGRAFVGGDGESLARHLDELASAGLRKVLVFVNTRAAVEVLTAQLRGRTAFGDLILPHHGSLAKNLREDTERRFLEASAAVAVATMTLEIGIDIGTVDYVFLTSPPPSVSSLLQRIGRGNRRGAESRVGYVVSTDAHRLWFSVLLVSAARGELCADPYAFRPGAIVQQALVLAGSAGSVGPVELRETLPGEVALQYGPVVPEILAAAAEEGLLELAGGRYVLSEPSERRYGRGQLHANFEAERDIDVVDRATGRVVGGGSFEEVVPGSTIRLGGRDRTVVSAAGGALLTDAAGASGVTARPTRARAPVSFALAQAVARELGLEKDEVLQLRSGDGVLLVHGTGTVGTALLEATLAQPIARAGPVTILLERPIETMPQMSTEVLRRFLDAAGKRLARALAMGPFHGSLPADLRRSSAAEVGGVERCARFLTQARLRTDLQREAPGFWRAL
ncbi:MAG: DEAD/DEAH box helicase [Deltaproteobacteria bacterium]|nr:DEAD/DEAH box helicase [Deltaproteobacteria bacterium]